MKRTSLKRKTPMKRKTRLRSRNPERRRRMFDRNFGERGTAVRAMSCLAASSEAPGSLSFGMPRRQVVGTPCHGAVQAAHAVARGMGGCKGDRRSLVPLCAAHHREAGERGTQERKDFESRYEVGDLEDVAWRIAQQLDEAGLE